MNFKSFGAKMKKLWPKKHINMQGVIQNSTSVSSNHPCKQTKIQGLLYEYKLFGG